MCGRYTVRRFNRMRDTFDSAVQPWFDEFSDLRLEPRFNIAPTQQVPIIRLNGKGQRAIGSVGWGLIPHWTKGKPKHQPFNAKAETVATNGMFRQAYERRRCLVPADGFYEWPVLPDGRKQPTFIHQTDDELFAFAGLWERWQPAPDADPVDTFTIITTTPNELMAPIHNRMPVILDRADYDRWLDRSVPGCDVADLLKPGSSQGWTTDAVKPPRNDGLDRVTDP